jgi:hypothetical protein
MEVCNVSESFLLQVSRFQNAPKAPSEPKQLSLFEEKKARPHLTSTGATSGTKESPFTS